MTHLVLIRHGESNATVQRIVGGPRACTGLSPLGRDQAAALAERLARTKEVSADVLITSMYRRAIETAEMLAPALGGLAVEQVHDVGEHFPGDVVDGMSFEQFATRFGLTDWDGDPFEVGFPGGETVAAFQHRIANAFAQIVRDHAGKTIVVVCHGGVIDTAVRRFLQTPPTGLFEIHTLNTSITEFVLVGANRWRMLRYNDAAHLAGLARETPRVKQVAADVDRLELREVTPENVDDVRGIDVWPSQRQFVASVERSLVDAHHRGKRAWYRAAYVGERATGFVMVAEPNQLDESIATNAWYLWRFLVAGPYQRGGYGRRMLELVCDHIRSLPDTPQELFTSWIDGPGGPAEFYLRFGFEPTGGVVDGEVEARLTRWPSTRS